MKHLRYLWYVVKHKWYVFVACVRMGIPWRGLVHDLSKFLPSEWFPYVDSFYGGKFFTKAEIAQMADVHWRYLRPKEEVDADFDKAWLLHQRRNPHHWQFFVLLQDDDPPKLLPMPEVYVKEMVADWVGAGRATGHPDTWAWWDAHKAKMQLHPDTRAMIEPPLTRLRGPRPLRWKGTDEELAAFKDDWNARVRWP